MKIRNGFVSNSSSSSFVICVNKNITQEEKDIIVKEYIEPAYKEAMNSGYCEDDPCDFDVFITNIFNKQRSGIDLGDWIITDFGEASSEADFDALVLYHMVNIDEKNFKFKTFC